MEARGSRVENGEFDSLLDEGVVQASLRAPSHVLAPQTTPAPVLAPQTTHALRTEARWPCLKKPVV